VHGIAARRPADALAPPGWRNVPFAEQTLGWSLGESEVQLGYRPAGDSGVDFAIGGKTTHVSSYGADLAFVEQPRFAEHGTAAVAGALTAPMPGKVVKVLVAAGEQVSSGAPLVVLEAMKMEHTVRAAGAGIVRAIHVAVGDQVDADRLLAVVTAS
jgi:biotin carboxyl carrier protein